MSEISINTLKTMLANLDDAKKYQSLRDVMETLPAPDLAAVFEDLPAEKLPVLFRLCPKDLAADVFTELTPATQQKLIDGLTDTELKAVVDELFVDDATDLVEEMPASVVKRILAQAEPDTRKMINELLKYPEDSAGGVMTTEFMELAPDWTVRSAMDAIRQNGIDKETINNCYVTRKDRTLVGVVSLRALVLEKNEQRPVEELMNPNVVSVVTSTDREDAAQLIEKYGLTQETAAKKLGKSRSSVTNSLRLLALPQEVRHKVSEGILSAGHAKVLLGLPTQELMQQAAEEIEANGLNVRQTEALCKKLAKPAKPPKPKPDPFSRPKRAVEIEAALKEVTGSEVHVEYKDGKGSLKIDFYSDEMLQKFADLLGHYDPEAE